VLHAYVDYGLYLKSEITASKIVMLKMPLLYTSSMHRNWNKPVFVL